MAERIGKVFSSGVIFQKIPRHDSDVRVHIPDRGPQTLRAKKASKARILENPDKRNPTPTRNGLRLWGRVVCVGGGSHLWPGSVV